MNQRMQKMSGIEKETWIQEKMSLGIDDVLSISEGHLGIFIYCHLQHFSPSHLQAPHPSLGLCPEFRKPTSLHIFKHKNSSPNHQ